MRIGIDATTANPPRAGIGNFTYRLINALSRGSEHEFVLYFNRRRPNAELLEEWDRFAVCRNPLPRSLQWRLEYYLTPLTPPVEVFTGGLDVFHSTNYFLPPTRSKTVTTIYDMEWKRYPENKSAKHTAYFERMLPLTIKAADAIVTISESSRRDILEFMDVREDKIHIVYPGIDPLFRPVRDEKRLAEVRARHQLPERFLLYVGTLEPRKNLPLLLRAYRQLKSQGLDRHLVLVGMKGWYYEEIFKLIEDPLLEPTVKVTGYVAEDDLPAIYSLADLMVYPSFYEGFGFPIVEAMACGLPVITSDTSSMTELAQGVGRLIDPRDEEGLVSAIREVLADRAERERMAQAGIRKAAEFTWERTAQGTLAVYDLLAGNGASEAGTNKKRAVGRGVAGNGGP